MMQHLENELRRTGDAHDAERADHVATMLKARGKDVPFSFFGTINIQGEISNFAISTAPLEEAKYITASDFLKVRMGRLGLSVRELSLRAGMKQRTVYRILEKGSSNSDQLELLLSTLGLTPDEFNNISFSLEEN